MWYSNDMFLYMFKVEFVALVSLKVPSGSSAAGILARGGVIRHFIFRGTDARNCLLKKASAQFKFFLMGR